MTARTVRLPKKPTFRPLMVGGEYNRQLRAAMDGQSGVYVLRRIGRKRATYVGESHTGRAWKTMLRHFHGRDSFRKLGEWVDPCPSCFEVAWFPTTADRAQALEPRAIHRYKPRENIRRMLAALDAEVPF